MADEHGQAGRPNRDDIRGDKRKEETVMLTGDNMADLVAQARAGADPSAGVSPGTPAAQRKMNTTLLVVAGLGVALLVVVLVLLIGF